MISFEIIGNKEKAVAIINSSRNLKKDIKIAHEIVKKSKHVKTVLAKASERKGKLRKRKYKVILGNQDTEVIHKEYGFLLKLDPQKVYFSPRESTERQRIASQIKKNEKILVMFSGIAPFICAIKRKQPIIIIYGIELNKIAHQYALQNIALNRLENVKLIQGDVKNIIPKIRIKFDRILMPLPKTSAEFLVLAFKKIKKNGIINYYSWGKKEEFENIKKDIQEEAKKANKKIKILKIEEILPYAPKTYKLRIDIRPID